MTKVFLVDDEIVIREGIRSFFPWNAAEYQLVGEAPDGEIALSMIRDTKPDILVTDIRMPFMDGLELSRVVRRRMPWIGIIILSGYDEFEYARKAIQLGVREYLLKPITSRELRQALDRVSALLEEERKAQSRPRLNGEDRFVKEKLLAALYSEDSSASDVRKVLSQLESMDVSLAAGGYVVVDAAFTPAGTGLDALRDLAESSGGIAHLTGSRAGGRILVLGENEGAAEEQGYAFADSAATELERAGCRQIMISIGETVSSPDRLRSSMKSAAHIRHVLGDPEEGKSVIVGVRDFSDTAGAHAVTARARMYLAAHYSDSGLMLKDVAGAVGMSESRFSTVFAQDSGRTFTEYLTGLRLSRAKELLSGTDLKSAQIALEVGYNDAHYFSYLFKKNLGLTPGEYRLQNQNKPE